MAGGIARSASVQSGGARIVYGTASNTVVSSGGFDLVLSGGLMNGGTAESSTITFASGGTLKLDHSAAFGGTIAGLASPAEVIDLADISFGSSTTLGYSGNTLSGTLTVSDGTHTALLSQYVAANFNLASDGHGGTLVTDPPVGTFDGQSSLTQPPHA